MIALLFLCPLISAILMMIKPSWDLWAKWLTVIVQGVILFSSLWSAPLLIGDWPHYAGIAWILDDGGHFLGIGFWLLWTAYSFSKTEAPLSMWISFFYAAIWGILLTADLFHLFVMFELLVISSLGALGGIKILDKAKPFIWINLMASGIFLLAIALTYQLHGSIQLVDLSTLPAHPSDQWVYGMLTFAFFAKAGIFPLMFWMPSLYKEWPLPLLLWMGALGTKIGLIAWMKINAYWLSFYQLQWQVAWMSLALLSIGYGFIRFGTAKTFKDALPFWALIHAGILLWMGSQQTERATEAFLITVIADAILWFGIIPYAESRNFSHQRESRILIYWLISAAGIPLSLGFFGKWKLLSDFSSYPIALMLTLLMVVLQGWLLLRLWLIELKNPTETKIPVSFFDQNKVILMVSLLFSIWMLSPQSLSKNAAKSFINPSHSFDAIRDSSQTIEIRRNP